MRLQMFGDEIADACRCLEMRLQMLGEEVVDRGFIVEMEMLMWKVKGKCG